MAIRLTDGEYKTLQRIIKEQSEWGNDPATRHKLIKRWLSSDPYIFQHLDNGLGNLRLMNPNDSTYEFIDFLLEADVDPTGKSALVYFIESGYLRFKNFTDGPWLLELANKYGGTASITTAYVTPDFSPTQTVVQGPSISDLLDKLESDFLKTLAEIRKNL